MLQSLNAMKLLFNKRSSRGKLYPCLLGDKRCGVKLFPLCLLDFTRPYENLRPFIPHPVLFLFIHEKKTVMVDFTPGLHQAELLLHTIPASVNFRWVFIYYFGLHPSHKNRLSCAAWLTVCFHHAAQISRTLFMPSNVTLLWEPSKSDWSLCFLLVWCFDYFFTEESTGWTSFLEEYKLCLFCVQLNIKLKTHNTSTMVVKSLCKFCSERVQTGRFWWLDCKVLFLVFPLWIACQVFIYLSSVPDSRASQ